MARPRKIGPREQNGQLQRNREIGHLQRQMIALRAAALDGKLGTPLGLLVRTNRITERQYEAGCHYAHARADADAALSLPRRSPCAIDLLSVRSAGREDDDPETIRRKQRAIERFNLLQLNLGIGSPRHRIVTRVCCDDTRHETHEEFVALVAGLDAIDRLLRRGGRG
ncbi:hypothetical protein [Alsobacter sp. R-9]